MHLPVDGAAIKNMCHITEPHQDYLEPIPKFNTIISLMLLLLKYARIIQKNNEKEDDKKDNRTIITIPDELWDEIKVILPREKPLKTVGRPILQYRKVT